MAIEMANIEEDSKRCPEEELKVMMGELEHIGKQCGFGGARTSVVTMLRTVALRKRLKEDGVAEGRMRIDHRTLTLLDSRGVHSGLHEQLYELLLTELKTNPDTSVLAVNTILRDAVRQLLGKEDHEALLERFRVAFRKKGDKMLKTSRAHSIGGKIDLLTKDKQVILEVVPKRDTNKVHTDMVLALGKLLLHKKMYPAAQTYIATSHPLSDEWNRTFKEFGIGSVVVTPHGDMLFGEA